MRLHEIEADDNTIYFAFINSNPPTFGYKRALDTLKSLAKNASYIAFINPAYDGDEFPLKPDDALKYNKKVFPNTNFYEKNDVKNPIQALHKLSEKYSKVYFVTRDNSIKDFRRMKEYAENWNIESFDILGLGDSSRPLPTGTSKKAAMDAVMDNDYDAFKSTIPTNDKQTVSELFITLRKEVLNENTHEDLSETIYSTINTISNFYTQTLYESSKKDSLGNSVIDMGSYVSKLKGLKLILGDKFKTPKLGKDNSQNYVLMFNTDIDKLREYMDLNEHHIRRLINLYIRESITSGNVASSTSILGKPVSRKIDYSFINDIKKSNSYNKKLDSINYVLNNYGYIDRDIVNTIEEKLNV